MVSLPFSQVGVGGLREARAEYWQLKDPGQHRLLIVFPVPGSVSWPQDRIRDMVIAWQWPREHGFRGFHLLIMDTGAWFVDPDRFARSGSPEAFQEELRRVKEHLRGVVVHGRQFLDWAETRPEIDMRRVGVTGASIGGVVASLVMGADTRIASGLFMMAGEDFGTIMAESKEESMRMIRDDAYRKFGWSQEVFRNTVRALFCDIDPMVWARVIPPRPAHMFIAEYDTHIPAVSSWGLWEHLGRQRMPLVFYAEHKISFFGMSFLGGHRMEYELYRFFSKTLQ
ncbi:MAG: hypothetical protein Q7S28_04370 [bacterium]|nr:hypothetical protein [bacterium]